MKESSKQIKKYPSNSIEDPCVHCGFCLPSCASYRVLGTEMDSPRGRIHTLKAIKNGELKMDATIASHFDSCLGCFACVTACPSGVRYDQLIEATRPTLNKSNLREPCQNTFRQLLLNVLPYPKRLRAILQTLRPYTGTSFQRFCRGIGLTKILGPQIEAMETLLPLLPAANFKDQFQILNPAKSNQRGRVGLVIGCVQRCFDPEVNHATIAVLQANGFEVVIPEDQGCCGAVTHHQGMVNQTKRLAESLVKSFDSAIGFNKPGGQKPLEAVLVAASGCGHTMKSYDHLINQNKNFQVPIFDVHEFLAIKGFTEEFQANLKPLNHDNGLPSNDSNPFRIAYHDACHMIHGQGIAKEPRKLLQAIPHLTIHEAVEAGVCCGSAGIYNLVQPKEAAELGQIKIADLIGTGAELIASANIGCTLQLRAHASKGFQISHPMELLARSASIN